MLRHVVSLLKALLNNPQKKKSLTDGQTYFCKVQHKLLTESVRLFSSYATARKEYFD
jgi:hypothetical protein